MTVDVRPTNVCRKLLRQAGISSQPVITSLHGGANNRVFKIETRERRLALKIYFQHPGDKRSRLEAEFGFCRFAWSNGVEVVPKPMVMDKELHAALYEFIDGKRILGNEVIGSHIDQALKFVENVNIARFQSFEHSLPIASEAAFSLISHLSVVDKRIKTLEDVREDSDISRDVLEFVNNHLSPSWESVRSDVTEKAARIEIEPDIDIDAVDRVISPSDFGFHNSLIEGNGKLRFIDFEYSGWDDPAKLVCDFFCQPEVPVPMVYYSNFADSVAKLTSNKGLHLKRMELLLPVHRIKWCCILLNEFIPVGSARREFAGESGNYSEHKEKQLLKAREMLDRVVYTSCIRNESIARSPDPLQAVRE